MHELCWPNLREREEVKLTRVDKSYQGSSNHCPCISLSLSLALPPSLHLACFCIFFFLGAVTHLEFTVLLHRDCWSARYQPDLIPFPSIVENYKVPLTFYSVLLVVVGLFSLSEFFSSSPQPSVSKQALQFCIPSNDWDDFIFFFLCSVSSQRYFGLFKCKPLLWILLGRSDPLPSMEELLIDIF